MRILLSNDDGYLAPGIKTLFAALQAWQGQREVVMVAPDRNRSAASNSLTLENPLRIQQVAPNIYSVNGTPTDCVHLGINGAIDFQADMVISGINAGANMGDDVLYSGTVAAATEGRFLGKPAIAISLCGEHHFDSAAHWLIPILEQLERVPMEASTILNINVPDRPLEAIRGVRVTRLGRRHQSEPVVCDRDPRGLPIYWIGPAGDAADNAEGTDFHAVAQGYVSVTPLQIDLTHHRMLEHLQTWLTPL
ncbi:5'/3'-nucleotidase SurE [Alcanivorax sp.]|uniref:5'/3'-nucleotidase SurE n=1 Tax=Alcanivorax sp. TaxID=1872427 RepID=UPI00258678B1|nr:5'/3'-nucleotidase SurE [Alcanivorax sp.]